MRRINLRLKYKAHWLTISSIQEHAKSKEIKLVYEVTDQVLIYSRSPSSLSYSRWVLCLEWTITKKFLTEDDWNKSKLLLLKNVKVRFASINYKGKIEHGGAKEALSRVKKCILLRGWARRYLFACRKLKIVKFLLGFNRKY